MVTESNKIAQQFTLGMKICVLIWWYFKLFIMDTVHTNKNSTDMWPNQGTRGIQTHFCRPNIAMGYPPSWSVAHGGWVIVLPAFSGARLTLRNGNPGKNLRTWSEQVAIHAAENADMVKLHTLFLREIKIYAIWLIRGLFTKKSGSTITLPCVTTRFGESGFPFLTSLDPTQVN